MSQAVAMAIELGDQRLMGRVHSSEVGHHWTYLEVKEAVDAGKRAAELLRSAGDLWSLAGALWGTDYALLYLGRLDETERIREEAEPLAVRLGDFGALLAVRRVKAARDIMLTGDIAGFEVFAMSDLELCRNTGMPWIANSYTMLGYMRFLQGRWTEALEHFQEGAKLEPGGFWTGFDWVSLFMAKAYVGEGDSALSELGQRRSNLPSLHQPNTFGSWTMLLGVVEGLAVLDQRTDAAELYDLVLQAIDTGTIVIWFYPLLQAVAGIAASCGEQWEKAEAHYQTALRQAHELPVVIAQPEVRRWYARMLIDRDGPRDRDKARQLLTEAITMYRKIGMPKHVEMAEALLSEP